MKASSIMTIVMPVLFLLCAFSNGREGAKIHFTQSTYGFGAISENAGKVSCTFHYVNTGAIPLIVSKTSASCSCTKIDFKKRPVNPGDTATLVVTYNPKGQRGFFAVPIQIFSNTEHKKDIIVITGEVKSNK